MTAYDDYLAYVQSLVELDSAHSSALARAETRRASAESRLRTERDENSARFVRLNAAVEDQHKQAESLLKAVGLADLLAEAQSTRGHATTTDALPDLAVAIAAQRSAVASLRQVLAGRRAEPVVPAASRSLPASRQRARRRVWPWFLALSILIVAGAILVVLLSMR